LAIAGVLLCAGAAPDPTVSYRVTPVFRGGDLESLAVEMRFLGDPDGSTRLALSTWGDEPRPWSKVVDLAAEGALVRDAGPVERLLRHRPRAPIVVRYRVVSAHAQEPSAENIERVFRPIIRAKWFAAYGEAVFATVEGRGANPARFDWGPAPPGWRLASDLDHVPPRTVDETLASFLVGAPELRVLERNVMGGPLKIAFRGDWSFTDEAFAQRMMLLAETERRFWGDEGASFFISVLGLPPLASGTVVNGTGRGADAFVLFGTTNLELDQLTRVLAHEQLHSWIDGALGGRYQEEEGLEYWFSEGFTDYYTLRLLLGSGIFTLEDFARELNGALSRYSASPVQGVPNRRIPKGRLSDPHVADLPYDRGHVFAALLDHQIRRRTGGQLRLDDVLRAQRRRAKDLHRLKVRHSAGRLLPIITREMTGLEITPLLERHIVSGEPVVLPSDVYGDCIRIEVVKRPRFDRGFDLSATEEKGGVVTGVRKGSTAHAAGLRDGMKLLRREIGAVNDPEVEIGYRVLDGGVERLIRFLPAGGETMTAPRARVVPALTPADRLRCARQISGVRLPGS
jgi:predicted metalloprotease with PDZ domain